MATMNSLNNTLSNGTSAIVFAGDVTFSGAYTFTATLTAATAVTFPTSGTLATTAQVTGVLPFTMVTGTTQAAAVNQAYGCNNAGDVTVTLPATAVIGSEVQVSNLQGGFTVAQNAGQSITVGNLTTTTGTGGSLSSSDLGDNVILKCVVANSGWYAYAIQGNLTVV
jgi:hypothetical protein